MMQWLQNLAHKGEQILKLAVICRKMETLEEKVVPFSVIDEPSSLEAEGSQVL